VGRTLEGGVAAVWAVALRLGDRMPIARTAARQRKALFNTFKAGLLFMILSMG
jgi:hypothetical protein